MSDFSLVESLINFWCSVANWVDKFLIQHLRTAKTSQSAPAIIEGPCRALPYPHFNHNLDQHDDHVDDHLHDSCAGNHDNINSSGRDDDNSNTLNYDIVRFI